MKIRAIRRAVEKAYPLIGLDGRGLTDLDRYTKTGKKIYWCKMTRKECNLVRPWTLKERIRRQEAWAQTRKQVDGDNNPIRVQTAEENLRDVKRIERQLTTGEINN